MVVETYHNSLGFNENHQQAMNAYWLQFKAIDFVITQ